MRTAPKARQPKFPMMIDLTGHEDGNSQGILATTLGYDRILGFLAPIFKAILLSAFQRLAKFL